MKPAELRAIEGAMTPGPWTLDDETPCIYAGELGVVVLSEEVNNYDGDGAGIVVLRDHAPALIELADAVARWRSADCETESSTTDDYMLAVASNECAGDTHVKECPVAVALQAVLDALAAVEALP